MNNPLIRTLLVLKLFLIYTLLTSIAYGCSVELSDTQLHECGRLIVFESTISNHRSEYIRAFVVVITYGDSVSTIDRYVKIVEAAVKANSTESIAFTAPIPHGATNVKADLGGIVDSQGRWLRCQ